MPNEQMQQKLVALTFHGYLPCSGPLGRSSKALDDGRNHSWRGSHRLARHRGSFRAALKSNRNGGLVEFCLQVASVLVAMRTNPAPS